MEDEVSKHTKKIYKTIKSHDHSFGEKLREIIVEILIIVFAVSLSIWFHSWSEHRHEQKEVKEFLNGLKDDLGKDIKLMEESKKVIGRLDSNFSFILGLDGHVNTYTDQEIGNHLSISIPVFHPNIGRYEGFKSSGKIGTIENDSLKENILSYYQQTLPELAYTENFINSWQLKILDAQIDKNDKTPLRDFLLSSKMKGLFLVAVNNLKISSKEYNGATANANKIIEEIDTELEK